MSEKQIIYFQPSDGKELLRDLGQITKSSIILAGGTDVLPMVRVLQPEVDAYLSLSHMEELKQIERVGNFLKIGAMATHTRLSEHPDIRKYFKALSMACERVGSRQIRNKGTIGGSLVNATPAGDMMPCAFLFHGEMEIMDFQGKTRRVPAEEFLTPEGKSDIGEREILKALWLPVRPERKSCFVKLGTRREVTISQISICLSWELYGGECRSLEGYLGAVEKRPLPIQSLSLLEGRCPIPEEKTAQLSEILEELIRGIRQSSKRESRLRITESEKVYKERAVKGVVYDAVKLFGED